MNVRHEAILWGLAVAVAIALGLVVVRGAITVAFSQPNLAPLYFSAIPYRQDDYSTENELAVRLNPLDPSLEQEAILEDQARSRLVLNDTYRLRGADHYALPTPINTLPILTKESPSATMPAHTATIIPSPSGIPAPINSATKTATDAPAPTAAATPTPAATRTPQPTNTPAATLTLQPTNTPTATRRPSRRTRPNRPSRRTRPSRRKRPNRRKHPNRRKRPNRSAAARESRRYPFLIIGSS